MLPEIASVPGAARSLEQQFMTRLDFIKHRLVARPAGGAKAIFNVLAAIAVPTLIRAAIDSFVTGTTFVAYYPFVLVAALVMTWRLALVVALCSAVIANFLFVEPRFTFFSSSAEILGALFFLLSSALTIAVGNTLRMTVRQLEETRIREAHLNRELQHRVKNTLAVVQGLAVQTFRDLPAAKDWVQKLQGRISALAQANEVLRDGEWETCRLPDLAVRALEPFNVMGAIGLAGPECCLPEDSCVPLVLALHELATNAVKYGALSDETGTVDVSWAIVSMPEGDELILDWKEAAGPPVNPPTHRGLGSKLLRPQRGLRDVVQSFGANGVSCRFNLAGVAAVGHKPEGDANMAPATIYSTSVPKASFASESVRTAC